MKQFFLMLVLVIAGCLREDSTYRSTKLTPAVTDKVSGNQIEINYGQTVYHEDFNLTVSFDSLSESRCPPDVVCIWAGDVVVFLNVEDLSDHTSHVVKLGLFGALAPLSVKAGNFQFELLEINQPSGIQDYKARIQISKLP